MPRLRRLNGKEVVSILERLGFEIARIRGSHYQLRQSGKPIITVPVHGNTPLKIGTLKSIFRQASQQVPEEELIPFFFQE